MKKFEENIRATLDEEIRAIFCLVAIIAGLSAEQVFGRSKAKHVTAVRQLAMLIAHRWTGASLVAVGGVSDRDHTTVLFGIRAATARMESHPEFQVLTDRVLALLEAGGKPKAIAEQAEEEARQQRKEWASRAETVLAVEHFNLRQAERRRRMREARRAAAKMAASAALDERKRVRAAAAVEADVPFAERGPLTRQLGFEVQNAMFCEAMRAAGYPQKPASKT
ncbi:MAG: hypothetical protein F9K29_08000 [Hyphomicrobiaceae bacterium]|nr:MAG: hypothetical protein F9K29_08000 [Hyphomicrobiaceae bacterium]